ncbi:MAG: hypothetical protein J5796_03825 [Erysipelotrichaceae bacterium]|nr:hypothetical protein [Erysipelotrichaceae bacterium]
MKKVLSILTVLILLVSCSSGNKIPEYEDFADSYVDTLPENAQDGLTLHAFNWTYRQIMDNLDVIAEAGFKNVLTMPTQQPKSFGSAWWAFYQPLSFSIGDKSPLGSKQDLIDLCNEADRYGICILVDAVVNHMSNAGDVAVEPDGTPMVDPEVAEYEPVLYNNRNEDTDGHGVTFHHNPNAAGTGSETQVYQWGNLPDLNTANPYVQERVLSFLKECIDAGVDGFRFDAAKHIETGRDNDYASNFWNETLGKAKEYYKEKTGKDLYAYGEILASPTGRPLSYYTSMMVVTDDGFVAQYRSCMAQKDPTMILNAGLKDDDPKKLIAWVESHDEYISGGTHYTEPRIAKYWAVIAAKKGLGGLYLARPRDDLKVGETGSFGFAQENVATANRFHNRFYNAASYESAHDTYYVNEKILPDDQGALIINVGDVDPNVVVEVNVPHMDNGNYYDSLTGEKVVVSDGVAYVKFEENGVAIITRSKDIHPQFEISDRNPFFTGEKEITITARNYESGCYWFNDDVSNKADLKDENLIKLNDHLEGDTVTLHLYLKNGVHEIERSFTYHSATVEKGMFNILNLDPKYLNDEYDLYIWSWSPGHWSQDYKIKDGTVLVDTDGMEGFLIAVFEKGHEIEDLYSWDSAVVKQSVDFSGDLLNQGFIDMSDF